MERLDQFQEVPFNVYFQELLEKAFMPNSIKSFFEINKTAINFPPYLNLKHS